MVNSITKNNEQYADNRQVVTGQISSIESDSARFSYVGKREKAIAIGIRIRIARSLASKTRKEFGYLLHVSPVTIAAWENGLAIPTGKNIENIVCCLAKIGIQCSEPWLIDGVGLSPIICQWIHQENFKRDTVVEEANYFVTAETNRILYEVCDDCMVPYYKNGDIVGGRIIGKNDIAKLFKKHVIAMLEDGEVVVRILLPGSYMNTYTLTCAGFGNNSVQTRINVPVKAVAEVVWHRYRQLP